MKNFPLYIVFLFLYCLIGIISLNFIGINEDSFENFFSLRNSFYSNLSLIEISVFENGPLAIFIWTFLYDFINNEIVFILLTITIHTIITVIIYYMLTLGLDTSGKKLNFALFLFTLPTMVLLNSHLYRDLYVVLITVYVFYFLNYSTRSFFSYSLLFLSLVSLFFIREASFFINFLIIFCFVLYDSFKRFSYLYYLLFLTFFYFFIINFSFFTEQFGIVRELSSAKMDNSSGASSFALSNPITRSLYFFIIPFPFFTIYNFSIPNLLWLTLPIYKLYFLVILLKNIKLFNNYLFKKNLIIFFIIPFFSIVFTSFEFRHFLPFFLITYAIFSHRFTDNYYFIFCNVSLFYFSTVLVYNFI